MQDDELDPTLAEQLRAYRTPPAVPREELWTRISAARSTPVTPLRAPWRRALPFLVPTAAAATVLIAFALGRITAKPVTTSADSAVATERAGTTAPTLAQQINAGNHLGRVEAFLTGFRAEARRGRADALAPEEARRLLAATRILLDSPGGRDQRIQPLLEDLELVLAEIAQLPAESGDNLDLITTGLDRRGTIAQLRSADQMGTLPILQGES